MRRGERRGSLLAPIVCNTVLMCRNYIIASQVFLFFFAIFRPKILGELPPCPPASYTHTTITPCHNHSIARISNPAIHDVYVIMSFVEGGGEEGGDMSTCCTII